MGLLSCCCPSASGALPEFEDAAHYLNAQCEQLLSDTMCPALQSATPAALVFGTRMFRKLPVHGMSPAAECTLTTLEGRTLRVRLDSTGLHLLPSATELWSDECFCEVVDVLAAHSPRYVAAFRDVNGVAPTVQRRKSTPLKPRKVRAGSLEDASQQWALLISRGGRSRPIASMRLHDNSSTVEITRAALL